MKTRIRLTLSQKYELADRLKATNSKKLTKRLLSISLRHYGYKISDIAKIQGVSERTVSSWVQMFLKGGFDQLLSLNYESTKPSRLDPYIDDIKNWRQQNPDKTLEELQQYLKDSFQMEVEYSWLYRFVKKRELWK